MKIDLHVHARERSRCSRATEVELIQAALACGLDAFVFTDHDRLVPPQHLLALNKQYAPFRVFGGIEVSVDGEHVLVLGLHDEALETTTWTYPTLHAFVRAHDGFLALAHPFRYHPIKVDLQRFPPDAIEIYSVNTPAHAEAQIREIARGLSIPLLSNSDAHYVEFVGQYYNQFPCSFTGEDELLLHLRQGDFTLMMQPVAAGDL